MKSKKLIGAFLAFTFAPLMLLAQVNFSSSNLPILKISTNSGQEIMDEPKIGALLEVIWNGDGQINHVTDLPNNFSGKIGIEVRGSSSQWDVPKKQFGFEIVDNLGAGISASLLGLPEEEDWILFAPYNDKSLMRDALAYQLGRTFGSYAPRSKFCELILNGNYQGIYVLIEKIKRDKNRVDIKKLEPTETSGEDITGGYILKVDKWTGSGGDGWYSSHPPLYRSADQSIYLQYEYPKQEEIVNAQKTYIQNYFNDFENALVAPNYDDPKTGYATYIDMGSFVDYFIMNELSKNVDGYRISTFMNKKHDKDGGKLHMGPIWDYNLGFGNADYCLGGYTDGWAKDFNQYCGNDGLLVPFWWDRMMLDVHFKNALAKRWEQLRGSSLSENFINSKIDSMATLLSAGAQQRNFEQWPVLGIYLWPNFYIGETYNSEVIWLKNWIDGRLNWMDNNIPDFEVIEEDILGANSFNSDHISVYPNPFNNQISFSFGNQKTENLQLEIFDGLGKEIFKIYTPIHQEYTISLDQKLLQKNSFYYYRISNKNVTIKTGKIIKE